MMGKRRVARSRRLVFAALGLIILVGGGPAWAEVVHFKQLLPLVELKLSGWTMEDKATGSTIKQGEIAVSQAQATYRNGDQTLEITVMDFHGQPIPFMAGMPQIEMESSEETLRSITIQGFKGLETFRTQDHHGELNLSVADRFWVKIDGNGINSLEPLRAAAQQLDLAKLAGMAK